MAPRPLTTPFLNRRPGSTAMGTATRKVLFMTPGPIDSDDGAWPKGGDELNHVVAGSNYG